MWWAEIGLQSPRLMSHVAGDSLPPEVNFGSGSCAAVHPGQLPVEERKGSKLLATGWLRPVLLPWYPLHLQESHENLPAIILSWVYVPALSLAFLQQVIISPCALPPLSQLIVPFPVSHGMRWGKMSNVNVWWPCSSWCGYQRGPTGILGTVGVCPVPHGYTQAAPVTPHRYDGWKSWTFPRLCSGHSSLGPHLRVPSTVPQTMISPSMFQNHRALGNGKIIYRADFLEAINWWFYLGF